jgi:hypothetical protein
MIVVAEGVSELKVTSRIPASTARRYAGSTSSASSVQVVIASTPSVMSSPMWASWRWGESAASSDVNRHPSSSARRRWPTVIGATAGPSANAHDSPT